MRYQILSVAAFLFLLGAGCATVNINENTTPDSKENPYQILNLDTPVQFAETVEPQEVVFYMGQGWMGGMGGYPVFEGPGDIKRIDDFGVYVEDEQARKLITDAGGLPECYMGTPIIKVAAKVHMVFKTGRNFSIQEAPEQSFYELNIDELYNVFIQAEPCEE
ncbi:MAG: hypothetical protein WCW16_04950 [Candidatus Magasanikbacteria bacterium]